MHFNRSVLHGDEQSQCFVDQTEVSETISRFHSDIRYNTKSAQGEYTAEARETIISYFRRSSRISTSLSILSLDDVRKLLFSSSFVSINL